MASTHQPTPATGRTSGDGVLFDEGYLKSIERLNLIARQRISSRRQAMRPSVKKGASLEFRDYREYSPGDDPRAVDWQAYMRLGHVYVKLYRQEEELDLWVLLDRSGSMDFGEPNKFDQARRIAAALAYIGMCNMDSASVNWFDGQLQPGCERMRGKGQVFRLLDQLAAVKSGGKTDLETAIKMFLGRVRKPGLVVLISDFYGLQKARFAIDRLCMFKHQTHVIQMVSPWELAPTLRGELRLVDVEGGGHQELTITDTMLRRYKEAFDEFTGEIRSHAMRRSVGYDLVRTDTAFDDFVTQMLQHGRLLA